MSNNVESDRSDGAVSTNSSHEGSGSGKGGDSRRLRRQPQQQQQSRRRPWGEWDVRGRWPLITRRNIRGRAALRVESAVEDAAAAGGHVEVRPLSILDGRKFAGRGACSVFVTVGLEGYAKYRISSTVPHHATFHETRVQRQLVALMYSIRSFRFKHCVGAFLNSRLTPAATATRLGSDLTANLSQTTCSTHIHSNCLPRFQFEMQPNTKITGCCSMFCSGHLQICIGGRLEPQACGF